MDKPKELTYKEKQKLKELLEIPDNRLSPSEKAKIKALKKKGDAFNKVFYNETRAKANPYGLVATTNTTCYSIRFLDSELAGITSRINKIKSSQAELVYNELGSLREINKAKFIRAALHLMENMSDEEIVLAIKDARTRMLKYGKAE